MDKQFWDGLRKDALQNFAGRGSKKEDMFPIDYVEDFWEHDLKESGLTDEEYVENFLYGFIDFHDSLSWSVLKQIVSDLTPSKKGISSFFIIPNVAKYPEIQNYKFSYEPNQRAYAKLAFSVMAYLQHSILDLDGYSLFNEKLEVFVLSEEHKRRLKIISEIIPEVEADYLNKQKEGIAYELIMTQAGDVRIKGAKDYIVRPDDGGDSQKLIKALLDKAGETVTRDQLVNEKIKFQTQRGFNDLLKDLKFVGQIGRLFVPEKAKDFARLNKIITHAILDEQGLDCVSPDKLTDVLRKKK